MAAAPRHTTAEDQPTLAVQEYGGEDYDTAPSAPRGPAQDNDYNGRLVPGHDFGASVPTGGELDLTRQARQSADALLEDILTNRQTYDQPEGAEDG
jgi:hypothetical protein